MSRLRSDRFNSSPKAWLIVAELAERASKVSAEDLRRLAPRSTAELDDLELERARRRMHTIIAYLHQMVRGGVRTDGRPKRPGPTTDKGERS